MTANNLRRIDLDLIEPNFLERVMAVIAKCSARGAEYHAIAGHRTYGAQMALWAAGRTKPGNKVTNAKGGQSAHCFGIAIDFVHDSNPGMQGLQPDWVPSNYKILQEEVELAGLHSGASYHDLPHVSLPGYVTAAQLLPLHLAWEKSQDSGGDTLTRLKQVWQVLNHG